MIGLLSKSNDVGLRFLANGHATVDTPQTFQLSPGNAMYIIRTYHGHGSCMGLYAVSFGNYSNASEMVKTIIKSEHVTSITCDSNGLLTISADSWGVFINLYVWGNI